MWRQVMFGGGGRSKCCQVLLVLPTCSEHCCNKGGHKSAAIENYNIITASLIIQRDDCVCYSFSTGLHCYITALSDFRILILEGVANYNGQFGL